MRRSARLPALLFLGTLLVQAAWILSVPPFRGVDEFDHAYRAAAVSRGEWVSSYQPAPDGRGDLVTVPRDLVVAAGPECKALRYTGHDNCNPVGDATGDTVQVATAASRYHPLFYWVMGQPARAFHGSAALYAMRVTAALLCAAFVALAGRAVSLWARTPWPLAALLASLTPTVLYSSTIAAPNGMEILAGLSVWIALAGLAAPGVDRPAERALLWAAVPGAMVLATVRSLGIGWLFLCVVLVLGVVGGRRSRELATAPGDAGALRASRRGRGRRWQAWLVSVRPSKLGGAFGLSGSRGRQPDPGPGWVLQSVATGIGRSTPAPGSSMRPASGSSGPGRCRDAQSPAALRRTMLLVAVSSIAGPLAVTLWTYRDVGVVWQGRYGLPFSLGLVVLAGLALERLGTAVVGGPWVLGAVGVFAVGQVVAALSVLNRSVGRAHPWRSDSGTCQVRGWSAVSWSAAGSCCRSAS